MDIEVIESMEEAFVNRYFTFSDDEDTKKKNLEIAESLFIEAKEQVDVFSEKIEDGEVIDTSECILQIQLMYFAEKYVKRLA